MARARSHPLWLAAPLIAVFAIAFVYPLARMLADAAFSPDLGTNLDRLVTVPLYGHVLARTYQIAFEVTAVTVVVAYPLAAFIHDRPPGQRNVLLAALFIPLLTSVVVRAYIWATILRPRGVLDGFAAMVGLPPLDGAFYQNDIAVVIGMLHLMIPFAALPLYAGFRRLDPQHRMAAATLGADWLRQWRRVIVPLTLPSIVGAAVLVFLTTLGFVVTPAVLGGPRATMLGVLVRQQVNANDTSFAALLAAALLVTTLAVLIILQLVLRQMKMRGQW